LPPATFVQHQRGCPHRHLILPGSDDESASRRLANGALLTPATKQRLIDAKPGLVIVDGVASSETGAQLTHMSTGDGGIHRPALRR
jgi:3-oxocholest-4-en-26-oate---CoA ligase